MMCIDQRSHVPERDLSGKKCDGVIGTTHRHVGKRQLRQGVGISWLDLERAAELISRLRHIPTAKKYSFANFS